MLHLVKQGRAEYGSKAAITDNEGQVAFRQGIYSSDGASRIQFYCDSNAFKRGVCHEALALRHAKA